MKHVIALWLLLALTAASSLFGVLRVLDVQARVIDVQARNSAAIKILHAQGQEAIETHRGVCAFRDSLQTQVRSSEKYLREHPGGAPSLHISAAQIEQSITREKRTIRALRGLNCHHS